MADKKQLIKNLGEYKKINLSDLDDKIEELLTGDLNPKEYVLEAAKIGRGINKSKGLDADIVRIFAEAENSLGTKAHDIALEYTGSDQVLKGKITADRDINDRLYRLWQTMSSGLSYKDKKGKTYKLFGDHSETPLEEALNQLQNYVSHLDEKGKEGTTWAAIKESVKNGNMIDAYKVIMDALRGGHRERKKGSYIQKLFPSEGIKDEHYEAIADLGVELATGDVVKGKMIGQKDAINTYNLIISESYDKIRDTYKPDKVESS